MGVKKLRDPHATQDVDAPRLDLDVSELHTYAVDWTPEKAEFTVDGRPVRTSARPPSYPMQMMVAAFDFPEWSTGDDDRLVPTLVVDHLRGSRPGVAP